MESNTESNSERESTPWAPPPANPIDELGAVIKPEESALLPDWLSNCYAAAGLILLSLEDSQVIHVSGMEEDPKKMWQTLETQLQVHGLFHSPLHLQAS